MNRANIAHIISDSPKGPRGDAELSPKLAKEFSNLMLMCYTHHRLIDHEGLADHPVESLQQMKAEHERRIDKVTGIQWDRQSDIIVYTARIGDFYPSVTFSEAETAVLSHGSWPASPYPLELGRLDIQITDSVQEFWQQEEEHLRSVVKERIIPPHTRGYLKRPSIFAIAPQPLLVLLGHLVRDISAADVYQRHLGTQSWAWPDPPKTFDYTMQRPDNFDGTPALVLALSAPITDDRITAKIGDDASIWRITIPQPDRGFLKSADQLQKFSKQVRSLLDEIKDQYPRGTMLNVFPVAPVAVCVELGRAIQPKAHMPMRLWDENKDLGGFVPALDINLPNGDKP